MDLSVSVSEECGHEEGGGEYGTLLSDTLQSNGLTETGTRPGFWLCNKPTDLSVSVSEEREHEGSAVVKLNSEKRVSTDVRSVRSE